MGQSFALKRLVRDDRQWNGSLLSVEEAKRRMGAFIVRICRQPRHYRGAAFVVSSHITLKGDG